jgi:hypothetical protein
MNWSTAKSTCEGKTAVTGGTWRLPSAKDWQYMFIGCGSGESYSDPSEEMKRSYSGLASKLTTAGGTALQVGEDYNYWSSSEYDISEYAWSLRFDGNDAIFLFGRKDLNAFVRACLAFAPAKGHALASSAVGEIVGSDGLAYYASDKNNLPSGVTAVAMVAYKNGNNGLAIALADEGRISWHDATSTCEGKTAIGSYSWKFPSQAEWQQMFSANGGDASSYSGLNSAIRTAGGTALEEDEYYWSSTVSGREGYAYRVHLKDGSASWIEQYRGWTEYVRACLAFGPAGGHALASSAVGEIVGSDGLAYYASDKNDLPLGVTAVAMIAYKSETAGKSLAIQLNASPANMSWSDACNYSNYPSIAGNPGTWRLPSKDDWQNMFVGCAKSGDAISPDGYGQMDPIAGFKEKIGATGITWGLVYYWSSTDSGSKAWGVYVNFNGSHARAYFDELDSSDPYYVLGCLAF